MKNIEKSKKWNKRNKEIMKIMKSENEKKKISKNRK